MKTLCILNCDNLPGQIRGTWNCEIDRHYNRWDEAIKSNVFAILQCETRAFDRFENRYDSVITDFEGELDQISMIIVNHNNQPDGKPKYEVFTKRS